MPYLGIVDSHLHASALSSWYSVPSHAWSQTPGWSAVSRAVESGGGAGAGHLPKGAAHAGLDF